MKTALKLLLILSLIICMLTPTQAQTKLPEVKKPSIFVQSQSRPAKRLSDEDISYLNKSAPAYIVKALENYKDGGTIRNNETADMIYEILNDRELNKEALTGFNFNDSLLKD